MMTSLDIEFNEIEVSYFKKSYLINHRYIPNFSIIL